MTLTELAQAKYEDGSTPDIEDVMNLSTFLFEGINEGSDDEWLASLG